jgi:glycosyltransferase involved in cell wall biosynthesis
VLPISACIVSYREEARIADCLRSVSFCDEVVVVDSGSDDRTREIAAAHGARVIEHAWPGHIEQKNFAIDHASFEWVLCLDCDERATPELRAKIEALFADGKEPEADGFVVNRRNFYLGRWIRHGGWYPDAKLRLFKRSLGRWGGENPHDHVRMAHGGCSVEKLDADLEHHSYEDLADHLATIQSFSDIAAAEKHAKGQRGVGVQLVFNPPLRWLRMFVLQRGFLDGWRGFLVASMAAIYVFARYAKLWERIHVGDRGRS